MADIETILDAAGSEFGVNRAQLLQPTRGRKNISTARQVAMYVFSVGLGKTPTETAHAFKRDRTTARHAILSVEIALDDAEFAQRVQRVQEAAGVATSV